MDIASLLSLVSARPGQAPRPEAGADGALPVDFAALLHAAQGETPPEALLSQLTEAAETLPQASEALQALADSVRELEAQAADDLQTGPEHLASLAGEERPDSALPSDAGTAEPQPTLPDSTAEVRFRDPQLAEIAARLALVANPGSAETATARAVTPLAAEMAAPGERRGAAQPPAGTMERVSLPGLSQLAVAPQALEKAAVPGALSGGERPALTVQAAPTAPLVSQSAFAEGLAGEPATPRPLGTEALMASSGLTQGLSQGPTPGLTQGIGQGVGQPAIAQASLAAPVATQAWEQQLGQQLLQLGQRGGQVELHLNPAELGPLSVSLKLGDQGAQAQFLSAHAQVRQAVEQALPQLREALAEQGIQLGEASVGEQRGDQAGGFLARGDAQGRAEGEALNDDEGAALAPIDPRQQASLAATLRGGVDLFA